MFSASGTLASVANGLPYSVGAAMAYPGRQVVCFIGDGEFAMLMGEMATLLKCNQPVKVIVIKNNVLGQIKWEQIVLEGNPQFGVQLHPIDFAAAAKAVERRVIPSTIRKKSAMSSGRHSRSQALPWLKRWTRPSRPCSARSK